MTRRRLGGAGLRRGVRVESAAPALAAGLDGFSTDGTGTWLGLSSNAALATATTMTWVAMFRIDSASLGTEYILSKGGATAADRGYAIHIQAGATIRVRFAGSSSLNYTPDSVAGWAGRTFIVLGTADATSVDAYIWHDGLQRAVLIDSDATPPTVLTDTRPLALGALRGDNGSSEANNVTIIGAGVGYSKMTQTQAQAFMAQCRAAKRVVSFAGESSRWNEADPGGLAIDQVGSNDLTANEGTSALTRVEEFTPVYAGSVISVVAILGQSNAQGVDTIANWTVALQAAYPSVQFFDDTQRVWGNLRPIADLNAGAELSAGRDFDAVISEELRVFKHAVGGTSLAVDWDPDDPGTQWTNWTNNWDEAQAELPDILDTLRLIALLHVAGEADAESESQAEAFEANEGAFIDAVRAYAPTASGFLALIAQLSDFQTQTHASTVRAAQAAVAAARPDAVLINTDNLTDLDGLHYDAASLESLGSAAQDAWSARSNVTAAVP